MSGLDLDAGKYALYVWGAYGATAAAFLWMIASSLLGARKWRRRVEEAEQARVKDAAR